MAKIEKELERAIKSRFKINQEECLKVGIELAALCREHNLERMREITPKIINEFRKTSTLSATPSVCDRIFNEARFERYERDRVNPRQPKEKVKSLGIQLHERLSSLNCYNKDSINSYLTIQNDVKKVTMYVDLNKLGIYSPIRYFAYKETVNIFTKWMKQKYRMVKNINEITEQQIKEYLIDRKAENISRKGLEKEAIALYHLIFLKKLR